MSVICNLPKVFEKRYLNPQNVLKYGSADRPDYTSVQVTIYSISEYLPQRNVAPNPQNKSAAEGCEASYKMGMFCYKSHRWLTKEQFDDDAFWNS